MEKLLQGLREFQENYIPDHQELIQKLAKGQHPRVLFIGCSDSRVDPTIITQADIGDLFIIRNAGNIIPPYEATNGGEGATIEYAMEALDIRQVIVCGHTQCGAMKGLLQIGELEEKMPLVYHWLRHTEATRKLVEDHYSDLPKQEKLDLLVAQNVLTQIDNLQTYPSVRSKLHAGTLAIHGWIYKLDTAELLAYDEDSKAFIPPHSKIYADLEHAKSVKPGGLSLEFNDTVRPGAGAPSVALPTFSEPVQPYWPGANRLSPEQAARIYRGSGV
ncbi:MULTISPECIES: carbonic anhydrase [Cyanophyceae]|uniref:carbonic anhydrase n=1 Tax=Cyanophyceae TaxID=3028117 RepID=UPI001687E5E9|nr:MULTISPECIES: carbonic anhydrase [Cyanophyceae]MBD1916528.1 carbonic anhydrase [Phormidium sp. FACHB-77]MBD2032095.1 carbonic anhydrase [Phormidium sp. FACHB-322]MBD2052975.1 carbonic anhydrase [Leptolyngbya sp. FACHB-60]